MSNKTTTKRDETLTLIAQRKLSIESLVTLNTGDDFSEVSRCSVREALEAAYAAGAAAAKAGK